jgi:hypothetical protein
VYRGGYTDVWKDEYQGVEVAVKVLTVYADSNIERLRQVGCPQLVVCINN